MEVIRKEDTIQAVLIADAYDKNFEPFIRERSSVSKKNETDFRK